MATRNRSRSSSAPAAGLARRKRAVILAGGKGERLGPYTTVLPKPLLPVGDMAILEIVVHQLQSHGFSELTFAVGYLDHLIRAVFDDGSRFGVSIEYHREREPQGTAGPLSTMGDMEECFLVMNGDVLTTLDYNLLLEAHKASGNAMTIASHQRVVDTDYGVLHTSESGAATAEVVGYEEKPEIPYTVSMGVYMLEPHVTGYVPQEQHFDMPDVVQALIDNGEKVGSYLFDGFWLDIGRHDDYERAILEFDEIRPQLFGNGAARANGATPSKGKALSTPQRRRPRRRLPPLSTRD